MTEHVYDVALSFAGEDRVFVSQVAGALREAGVDVFYDDYAVVELWGQNLVDVFEEVYNRRSRYVVIFVSRDYVQKPWTRHERQSAQARALVEQGVYVLPVSLDGSKLPGMPETVHYVDGRRFGSDEIATMVCQKLEHEPTSAIEPEPLGAPRDREQTMRLLAIRPGAWEYLLWAGLIHQGVQGLEPKWRDHQLRLRRVDGRRLSVDEFLDTIGTATDRITTTLENLETVMSDQAQEIAFGLPGEPGDPEAIEHIASRWVGCYEALLEWASDVRSLLVVDELRKVRDLTAEMVDMPLRDIRGYVDRIVKGSEIAAHHVASGKEEVLTLTLELKLVMDEAVLRSHSQEMRRLTKLRRKGRL